MATPIEIEIETETEPKDTTTVATETSRRSSLIQQGVEKMKDDNILDTTAQCLVNLGNTIKSDDSLAFDVIYANIPWKTVGVEYLSSLPVPLLVSSKQYAGLFMWVDSPDVAKANEVLNTWGFSFHTVIHISMYAAPAPTPVEVETNGNDAPEATTETDISKAAKKAAVPHGWHVDGILPSRSRQLWFAVKTPTGDASSTTTPYLKDISFIRKRLAVTSTVVYTKTSAAGLSSKKKNFENWQIFPEYDSYVAPDVRLALETIIKPNARVLSLFSDKVSRAWYTWGPNVPGYLSTPLLSDNNGLPLTAALVKYFSYMKSVTIQKYVTLVNLYATQLAKQLGSGNEDPTAVYLTPVVIGRMKDFFVDLLRRYQDGNPEPRDDTQTVLVLSTPLSLNRLVEFDSLGAEMQTQVLLLIGQVINFVLKKNTEASDRRKRAGKRRRDASGTAEGDAQEEGTVPDAKAAPATRTPRKFGIAAPVPISDDLADFMSIPRGEKVARTTVVKFINDYIAKNNLQNPERKSEILINQALANVLNPSAQFGPVTYFNLSKLLGPHFKGKVTSSSTANLVEEVLA